MQPREFLNEAQRALSRRGVFGSRSAGLLEEWHDHIETKTESLVASGQHRDEAGLQACKALGEPVPLANRAATALAQGTWQGRHPWLFAGIMFVLLAFVSVAITFVGASMLIEVKVWEHLRLGTLGNLVACISILPWVLGLIWLAWYARKMPAGWKGFWVVAGLVALGLNMLNFMGSPPHHGPGTGIIAFGFGFYPRVNLLKFIITITLTGLFWWRTTRFQGIRTVGQIAICLAVFCLSGCAIADKSRAVADANGRFQGMTQETRFTYAIPNSHKGPFSNVDRYNFVVENGTPGRRYANATFFLGKSRKTGEWEVFSVMVQQKGGKWEAIPVETIK